MAETKKAVDPAQPSEEIIALLGDKKLEAPKVVDPSNPTEEETKALEEFEKEKAGVKEREKLFDPKNAKDRLTEQYHKVMEEIRSSHDEWNVRGLHNLHRIKVWGLTEIRVTGTSESQVKEYIKDKAKNKAKEKFDQMGELAKSSRERIGWNSTKTARRLAELTSRVEVSDEVLTAVDSEKREYAHVYESFKRGMEALRAEYPIKAKFPWSKISKELEGPFSTKEYERIKAAANTVRKNAEADRKKYLEVSEKRFGNLRAIDDEMRKLLLNYDPSLLKDLDRLLADNASGGKDLIERIEKIFSSNQNLISNGAEQQALTQMARHLQPSKGRKAELFYRLENGDIMGRGSTEKVFTAMKKLRLGAPVMLERDGKKIETRVWIAGTGDQKKIVLKDVKNGKKIVLDSDSGKSWEIKHRGYKKPQNRYKTYDLSKTVITAIYTQI